MKKTWIHVDGKWKTRVRKENNLAALGRGPKTIWIHCEKCTYNRPHKIIRILREVSAPHGYEQLQCNKCLEEVVNLIEASKALLRQAELQQHFFPRRE